MRVVLGMFLAVVTITVAGCGQKGLHNLRHTGNGPDEFGILPSNPLSAPTDYAFLPAPTPGGGNLTDRNPNDEALVALGGKAQGNATQVPSSDAALVTASSRYGVPANARQSIQAEDDKFRKRQGRLTSIKLFPVDRYEQIYRKQKLDPFKRAEQYRRAGAATPSSPPPQ